MDKLHQRIAALEDELRRIYAARVATLTGCQRTILELMAEGKTNKVIARELGISPGTVGHHVKRVLRRLSATNRHHAVAMLRGEMP